jgi:hypothetical protein
MRCRSIVVVTMLLAAAACAKREPAPSAAAAPPVTGDAPSAPSAPGPAADRGDGAYPGFRAPAFTATVRRPGAADTALDSRATKLPTLYIINSTKCPSCVAYVDRIKAIETTYMAKGVDVVHVYPNRKEPDAEKIAWHAAQGFRGGQILDAGAAVSRALEAEKTPTAYVMDARGVILYRGGIDSGAFVKIGAEPYLADALDAVLAHAPVANDTTEPSG